MLVGVTTIDSVFFGFCCTHLFIAIKAIAWIWKHDSHPTLLSHAKTLLTFLYADDFGMTAIPPYHLHRIEAMHEALMVQRGSTHDMDICLRRSHLLGSVMINI